jgi:hypothetical protein
VTGGGLLFLMLLVSCTSLGLQSAAMIHLRRQRSSYAAEQIAGHGYVRTAACRVVAASIYVAVAFLDLVGVRVPGSGGLSPESLVVLTVIQSLWLFNTAMDIRVRQRLARRKGPSDGNS